MKRYYILDEIRGLTLCSMIAYHAVWDLVYIFGYDWTWYRSEFAYIWQQSICWCFILLSGFCFSLGKRKWRRGIIVLGAGAVVSIVTHLAMPEQSIRFGVLTMLGSSMLLIAFIEKIMTSLSGLEKWEPKQPIVSMLLAFTAFFLTRGINERYLGFEGIHLYRIPSVFYQQGDFMTYIGFMSSDFYSTDYFSMIPWFFLFLTGYFFYYFIKKKKWLDKLSVKFVLDRPFRFLGRHSLLIYMIHQPIIYGLFAVIF